jgi:SAM-dependent methyltransferase
MAPHVVTTAQQELEEIGQGVDPHARLFVRSDRILRALKPARAAWYAGLLEQPAVRELMEQGLLIDTRKSDATFEGFPVVLEHPRLTFVNYPFEWTASMLKAAALTMLRVNLRLIEDQCMIYDPHSWNVMFDGPRPLFIDFTSIVPLPADGKHPEMVWFERYFLAPLRLMAKGYPAIARALLRDNLGPSDDGLARSIIIDDRKHRHRPFVRRELGRLLDATRLCLREAAGHFRNRLTAREKLDTAPGMRAMIEEIEALDVSPPKGQWSEYYAGHNVLPVFDGSRAALDAIRNSTPKHQLIDRILATQRPATVLDMGCNNGLYSQMAAAHGASVAGIDTDEHALDVLYASALKSGASIVPYFANALAPCEAVSLALKPMPRLMERVRSDFVLCLALVHHLLFSRVQLSFEHVAELLATYTRRELLVEFIPPEDAPLRSVYPHPPDWYSLAGFESALRRYFPRIERHPSFPEPRILLHCQKQMAL